MNWDWLNELFTNANIYIPTIISFLSALGIPAIVATCRTAAKASVYLYNVKKLQKKTNENIDYTNAIKERYINSLNNEKEYLNQELAIIHNEKRKQLINARLDYINNDIANLSKIEVGHIELSTAKEIKEEKKLNKVRIKVKETAENVATQAISEAVDNLTTSK